MNENVVRVIRSVPRGSVTTVAAVSRFLMVPTDHVFYLLARRLGAEPNANVEARMQAGDERSTSVGPSPQPEPVPWHRVIARAGGIVRPFPDAHGRTQAQDLAVEGVHVDALGRVRNFAAHFYQPTVESTGVIPNA